MSTVYDDEDGRKRWRIVYAVTVEVMARDETDAVYAGERACGWPGDWSPPHGPVKVQGELNGHTVEAEIVRSQALMLKPVDG